MNSIAQTSSSNAVVYSDGSYTSSYSDVYNEGSGGTLSGTASAGTGDLSDDPQWSDVSDDGNYSNDDWSLSASSPCVDVGDPSSFYQDVDGSDNDMGAMGGPGGDW